METQNPVELNNGLRQFARAVRTRNDLLGLHTVQMRAPVGHDAVSAVRERSRLTAVTDDRVVGRLD